MIYCSIQLFILEFKQRYYCNVIVILLKYYWCILQKLRWVKFFYRIFLMKMVKYPQTYPLIPKIPLGWSIKSKFWRILKCTFLHVKYVVQRFVPRDLIFWSFAYCLTISESSCQPGSTGTQIWAQNSMIN